jgi:hypothetical protein
MSSLSEEIETLRELRKFTEAIEKLDGLAKNGHLSIKDRLLVTSEKAETLYDQGYFDHAERVLHNAIVWADSVLGHDSLPEAHSLRDLLWAKKALTMLQTMQTKSLGEHASSVREKILLDYCPEGISEVLNALTVDGS